MDDDVAIKVSNVSKTFKLPHEKSSSLKSTLINLTKRKKGYEKQVVLKNISFEVKKGEFFGIVGRNGSGKSTLLKLLAGIYAIDEGTIDIKGKLTPFIELGVGFNPELSGRENVFLNGALLGFDRTEMSAMYDDIVAFAELDRFMDQKLKNYSSGMQVRLAFSIAIRAKTDILLIDEVLAVGDSNFQKKCFKVFDQIKAEGRTVVFITHDMGAVEKYCDRAMLISNGEIVTIGDANSVAYRYSVLNHNTAEDDISSPVQGSVYKSGIAEITKVKFLNNSKGNFEPKDSIEFEVDCLAIKEVKDLVVGVIIRDQNAVPLYAINTQVKSMQIKKLLPGQSVKTKFVIDNIFSDGNYFINSSISSKDGSTKYDSDEKGKMFTVSGWEYPAYFMQPKHEITLTIN